MPKANWGIDATDVDDFDRSSQYTPYAGPIPPSQAVYQFVIKHMTYVAATREKNSQLRVGLELVPRKSSPSDRQYKGFFVMAFLTITKRNQFAYVPLLDCLGVSGTDFRERTITDEQGKIKRIGKWQNKGETLVLGQVIDNTYEGKTRADIGAFIPARPGDVDDSTDDADEDYDDEELDDTEYYDDEDEELDDEYDEDDPDAEYDDDEDYDEEEPEPEPAPRRRAAPVKKAAPARRATKAPPARQARRPRRDDF